MLRHEGKCTHVFDQQELSSRLLRPGGEDSLFSIFIVRGALLVEFAAKVVNVDLALLEAF